LIEGVFFNALLADNAFDANWLLKKLEERGKTTVTRHNRAECYNEVLTTTRISGGIEVGYHIAKIRGFRGVTTRHRSLLAATPPN
jgi:hypothetical protein